jgi:hypothetical protein
LLEDFLFVGADLLDALEEFVTLLGEEDFLFAQLLGI